MNDWIRTGIYTGMGTLMLARKKFEELVEELIQNNELTREEGRRAVQTLIHKAEDGKKSMESTFYSVADEVLVSLKLPTMNELEVKWSDAVNQLKSKSLFQKKPADKVVNL